MQLLEKLRPIALAETCRFLVIQSLEFQEMWQKNRSETTWMIYHEKSEFWLREFQEPITRSVQLFYFRATAFSQVGLFLDTSFLLKFLFPVTSSSEFEFKKWRPNFVVFAMVFRFPLVVFHNSNRSFLKLIFPQYHKFYLHVLLVACLWYIPQSASSLDWIQIGRFLSRLCNG